MGSAESTCSIVARWGDGQEDISDSEPKFDVIEIRSNKRINLTGIGIVRPINKSAQVSVEITNLKDDTIIASDKFTIDTDLMEKHCIKSLSKSATMSPGNTYRIQVIQKGASCGTYDSTIPVIWRDDHEISIKRMFEISMEETFQQINMITDLCFALNEKDRACC